MSSLGYSGRIASAVGALSRTRRRDCRIPRARNFRPGEGWFRCEHAVSSRPEFACVTIRQRRTRIRAFRSSSVWRVRATKRMVLDALMTRCAELIGPHQRQRPSRRPFKSHFEGGPDDISPFATPRHAGGTFHRGIGHAAAFSRRCSTSEADCERRRNDHCRAGAERPKSPRRA